MENGCNSQTWRRRNRNRSREWKAEIRAWMNKLSSAGKGAVMFRLYRSGQVDGLVARARITLNSVKTTSMYVPDKRSRALAILLFAGVLQSIRAASQELPDAPSTIMCMGLHAAECSDTAADPPQSSGTAAANPSNRKFLTRWVKRGLRDKADIYTAPLHRSEMKWVIGVPAVTLALIAIDKHASGALPRNGTSASSDISDVGLFTTAGAVGVFLLDGATRGNSHALETGVLGAEAMASSGLLYAVLQVITERQRPLQGTGGGDFFQTSGWDNSFPSGHTI